MSPRHALIALAGITRRESARLLRQHGRLAAAIVRPLVWLGLFAAGFRAVLGLSIIPPYETYILYEVYIVPGLCAMMLLFHGLQSSLAMVYDRETGSMRVLLTAPLPRWWLLTARLIANTLAAIPLVLLFLLVARLWDVRPPWLGYLAVVPALALAGLMLGAFGLALSSLVRQLENFAGVMNFVIFPAFFASTALYPLWRLEEVSPPLALAARLNPFTHAVELVRFALYLRFEPLAFAVCLAALAGFLALAILGYDPGRGFWVRRGAP
ncbi:MAG TPA: ABC transporter permease [Microvirga sp.]|jgi:ABC-2 type transport system permease protein|nr:ABC transporter permease [Microvirga sp.]